MSRIDGSSPRLTRFIKDNNYVLIAGTDEAGRGALAGPIVAAAVIINPKRKIAGVKDSKKLTPQKREHFYDLICEKSVCYAVGEISAAEIDSHGIQIANLMALEAAVRGLSAQPDCVLCDWYENDPFEIPWHGVKGGEDAHMAIAAASIIAKVTRDRIMVEMAGSYPEYGFDSHKGYGSETHLAALQNLGPSPIHRMSFEPCASYHKGRTAI